MIHLVVACIGLLTAAFSPAAYAQLSGPSSVTDGDSLKVSGHQVRLHGIDAPESAQTCRAEGKPWSCGRAATSALRKRLAGRPVACEERDRDRYRRIVAVCRVAGEDVNAWMVSQGWALAYRKYSADYIPQERAAKDARRGLWRGAFVPPWDWRRGERLGAAVRTDTRECRIKGNISRTGARIYHVPGGRSYEQTRIDTSKGERWFCTEAQAEAAGWRRSRR